MGTTVQLFFPDIANWDGTDPAGGDVRQAEPGVSGTADFSTTADLGTSGFKAIYLDPQTTRSSTATDTGLGWAINISGAAGMDGTATARRVIPAGTWRWQGHLKASPAAALNAVRVYCSMYRVAAAPSTTRTFLLGSSQNAGLVSTAGVNFDFSLASQPRLIMEAGETLQMVVAIEGTGQVGGLTIDYPTYTTSGVGLNFATFEVPTPGIRTQHTKDHTVTAIGVASRGSHLIGKVLTKTAVGVASFSRAAALTRAFTKTAIGEPTVIKAVTPLPKTATAIGVASVAKNLPRAFTATAVGVASRTLQVGKPLTATAVGVASLVRQVGKPLTATAVGVATVAKNLPRAFTATAVGVAGHTRQAGKVHTATAIGVPALIRTVGKPLTATAIGVAAMTRAITAYRSFTTTATGVAKAFVTITDTVLNRIVSGITTIRKFILAIFD